MQIIKNNFVLDDQQSFLKSIFLKNILFNFILKFRISYELLFYQYVNLKELIAIG